MRRTLLALSVVLPACGAADATDLASIMQFPSFQGIASHQPQQAPRSKGTEPASSAMASLGAPFVPGRLRYMFKSAPMRSTIHGAPGLSPDVMAPRGANRLIPCPALHPPVD
ncbi:hypothetical protein CO731_02836 [Aminobacter sp. MSH1]|uniref:Uncharacterized protein n=1 Tax=Aminobacter niigataensis TaxID=83265 RepID=A0ABR6KXT4_9HYPH|nr:hypothetical protein CO731_02836 [Aminobacter sp. MSH1]MBB4648749.1 hypothetical protein [Aminobacter niigataensis]CAI2934026.1 conserved exported protein of unknown function [Aminobacter niigataensis]